MPSGLPTGTVTFLFTDIEGSTRIAQQHREAWGNLQRRHHEILRAAIEEHKGYVFKIIGDAFCAAFDQPGAAVRAALQAQRGLRREAWESAEIRVRMGIHTGLAEADRDDYRGYLALSSVQRVMSAAHGGQVLLSQAAFDLVQGDLPEEAGLRDMGQHRLKDLLQPQHLYQLVVADLPSEFPALKSLEIRPNNLPVQLTSFVGREQEIRALTQMIGSSRLLTLTGTGGTGKTRLSLQAAAEILDEFKDGVWLVELAPLSDPALIHQAIARALNIHEQPGRRFMDVLKDHLRGKDLLLVMDNVEHLLDACAQVVDELLREAPGLTVLVTGREALGIVGETTFSVRSLPLPAPGASLGTTSQSDSVRLFVERAVAVQSSFQFSDQNASAVAEICTRLDGIPLAIELAAARMRGMGAEEIAARLSDRFRLLTGGSRTAMPRHRTLQATLEWSYNLLSECERLVLRRLSVFAGGWTLAAAETVCAGEGLECADILDMLSHLVDKSLVIMDQGTRPTRYRMLETIREYARDRFSSDQERAMVQERHCDYFAGLAEQAYAEQETDGPTWLQRLELEHDNMRAALDWASTHSRARELQLAGGLGWFWEIHAHYSEGRRRLATALQGNPGQNPLLGRARIAAGSLALAHGELRAALPEFQAALALGRESWARGEIGRALRALAEAELAEGDYGAAQRFAEQALAIYRELEDPLGVAWSLLDLGQALAGQQNFAAARAVSEEAYPIATASGKRWLLENAEHCMGDAAMFGGDCRAAIFHYAEAVRLGRELGDAGQIMFDLEGLGMATAAAGHPERALKLAGASLAIRDRLATTGTWGWWEAEKEHWLGQARRELGEEASAAAVAGGRAMSFEQACEFALGEDEK